MSKIGPLNDLFSKDTITFTSPDGEVVPVNPNSLAKVNPEKVEARKALDRAREAMRIGEGPIIKENFAKAGQEDAVPLGRHRNARENTLGTLSCIHIAYMPRF